MKDLDLLSNDLQVFPVSQNFLREVAKWGKFLSIIGFIFCGFLAIAAFFVSAIYVWLLAIVAFFAPGISSKLNAICDYSSSLIRDLGTTFTVIYLGLAALLFFPCYFLNKFSIKMRMALDSVSHVNFEDSLKNLKSLLKFYGIFTIIVLSFYVLVFILGMLGIAMQHRTGFAASV
ncbi:MAG TPA: hypothetical protein VIJ95_11595 [Hanamia sp.]